MHGTSLQFVLGAGWLASALLNPLGLFCLVTIALSTILIALSARTLHHSSAKRPLARRFVEVFTDDRGTATMEFALVCPVLLFFSLLLAQTTLMMTGNLFVHYASFAATRSAIVQIPLDKTEEGYESANQFANSTTSPKYIAVQRAAAFALMPVAGTGKESETGSVQLSEGMTRYYQSYSKDSPAWVEKQLNAKARYALENTQITVYETWARGTTVYAGSRHGGEGSTDRSFGPKDPVTVKVEHKFNLAFPYVGAIFADGRLPEASGGGLYSTIVAFCTLTNEGIIDAMPEVPTQRNPPSPRR
jgi:hypothetical protein